MATQRNAGKCRCGQMRFEVDTPPLMSSACHYTGCQRTTSSAFSLSTFYASEGFKVTAGEAVLDDARRIAPFLRYALQELALHAA